MNFKEIKNQIKKEGRLFDDQLIECAKNNYNKGRLSVLKDELEFLHEIWNRNLLDKPYDEYKENQMGRLKQKISQIQKEIKEIEND